VTRTPGALIVGERHDPHADAVLGRFPPGIQPLVMNVNSLIACIYCLRSRTFTIQQPDGPTALQLLPGRRIRGWIRRLASPGWQRGVVAESHEAALKTAWLTLLTSVLRLSDVTWLTPLDHLVIAENKLGQYAAAARVGVRVPLTVVTNDAAIVRDVIGSDILLKPLGPAHCFDDDEPYVVPAAAVASNGPELRSLSTAPFIAQQRLSARLHLRVVTVNDGVWACKLDAGSRPLDWRTDSSAHRSFKAIAPPPDVTDGALAVARELHLGYTSQDWVVTDDGHYLLDVNPAGQWLFLPPEVSGAITNAIAAWLVSSIE
jgi:hypothetical protein